MEIKQITIDDSNRVTIRIWYRSKLTINSTKRVGHVSLQTYGENGIYASLWPAIPSSLFSRQGVAPLPLDKMSYEKDKALEGGEPDIIVDLYTLDVNKINYVYNKIKNSGVRWATSASSPIAHPQALNCASLIRLLLIAGGIKELVSVNTKNILKITTGIGISLVGSTLLALKTTNRSFFKPAYGESHFEYAFGLGLGLVLLPLGIKIVNSSGIGGAHLINYHANFVSIIFSMVTKSMYKLISNILIVHGHRYDVDDENEIFALAFLAGSVTALISSAYVSTLKLLENLVVTPNEIAKIAKHAQVCEKEKFELVRGDFNNAYYSINYLD